MYHMLPAVQNSFILCFTIKFQMLRRDACFRRSEMLESPWPTHHRAHLHRPDKPADDHRGQLPRPTDCRPRLALGVHGREDPRRVRLGSSGNADLTRSERKFTFKRQRWKKYFTDGCSSFIEGFLQEDFLMLNRRESTLKSTRRYYDIRYI